MKTDPRRIQTYLQKFDFTSLFVEELGWDKSPSQTPLRIKIESQEFTLVTVAEKRGFVALCCKANKQMQIPIATFRRRIDQEVSHFYREHLIIYVNHSQPQQIWQWVDRRLGSTPIYREATFSTSYDLKILSFEQISRSLVQNGWKILDKEPIQIQISNEIYQLSVLAEKFGVLAYGCEPNEQGDIPNAPNRRKIDNLISSQSFTRLIIYNNRLKSKQIWQWGNDKIAIYEGVPINTNKRQKPLIQILTEIAISWENEGISLFEVIHRVAQAFNPPVESRELINHPSPRKPICHRSSLTSYLQEISRVRLIRGYEEIELARKIHDLLELERIRDKLCSRLEREPHDGEWANEVNMPLSAFRYRLHLGRRAKDKMVQSNLRLVVSIAKKYINRGLSFQDLIQEGNLGLIRSAEKFDHEKGYKFSTYATWWIRQAITRAIADQSRTIRLPVHLYETISRIQKNTKLLSQEMGRTPAEEEIATRMGMTIEKMRFIKRVSQRLISLNVPVQYLDRSLQYSAYWEEDFIETFIEFGECLYSDIELPEVFVTRNMLREDMAKVLSYLQFKERIVIKLRYGLLDGTMKTLEEIALIFNVTPERIRQIEAKALRKLRNSNHNKILKQYIR